MSYTDGQCTARAQELAPWIPDGLGNAATWAERAAALGFPVSHVPVVGRVAQWPAGYGGAQADGHVAMVTAVDELTITVSEENWTLGAGRTDTRVISANQAAGLLYIGPKLAPDIGVAMTMTSEDRLEVGRALADLAYWSMGHRAPEAPPAGEQTARDRWAQIGVAQGFPQMIEQMSSAPEFVRNTQADFTRDNSPAAG